MATPTPLIRAFWAAMASGSGRVIQAEQDENPQPRRSAEARPRCRAQDP